MHSVETEVVTDQISKIISFCGRFVRESCFLTQMIGKWRRLYLIRFRKAYVSEQLECRKGECSQCGTCCSLVFTCPLLTRNGSCLVYGKFRPKVCKVFPIDQKDLDEVSLCGGKCSYTFEKARRGFETKKR